jgi:hypothetical protein
MFLKHDRPVVHPCRVYQLACYGGACRGARGPSVSAKQQDISMAELAAHELDRGGESARFSPHGGAGCGEKQY